MGIKRYKNNVFTHTGTSDVEGFVKEINIIIDELKVIDGLKVFAGYHGVEGGKKAPWVDSIPPEFTQDEMTGIRKYLDEKCPNAELIDISNKGYEVDNETILKGIESGNVFFTWCYSDDKILELKKDIVLEKVLVND